MIIPYFKNVALVIALAAVAVFGMGIRETARADGEPVGVTQSFFIKLHSDNSAILTPVAQRITPQFEFSDNPLFQNIYTFESSRSLESLQAMFGSQADYIQPNIQYETTTLSLTQLPNDPGFTTNVANIDKQWGLVKAGFVDAWATTQGSTSTVVAVIDTGIDALHEDFINTRFIEGYNVVTGKAISQRVNSDDNGHGTLVAGVIGASTNNGKGVAGAAWNVTLMPIKALNSGGSGTSAQISEAIVWATDHGADVVNMSLGGIGFAHDTTLANAITYAYDADVVVVAAAGNDVAVTGGNLDVDPVFPICDDNGKNMIIGVTATDSNDLKPDFANYGKACVDVTAPGKRILSTINHDPATGRAAPNSYAYASGTSLATPFVSAQAALLKSLYPLATNRQIRDRIIATTDPIDNLNLSQCGGKSCAGLLGGGRINVARSIEQQIISIADGDVVQLLGTADLYLINGGKRQYISPFVRSQRFKGATPKIVSIGELNQFPEGSYAAPLDGTLVKIANDSTVYIISKGLKLPVTYQVFLLHNFSFANIATLSNTEVNSWVTGSFFTPPEGTLLRTGKNPTVYWVVGGTLHPINFGFYQQRGLNIFPVVYVSDEDVNGFPKGESYVF